jgi:hypothetical protein
MKKPLSIRICGVVFEHFWQRRLSKEWVVKDAALGWIPLTQEMDYAILTFDGWLAITYESAMRILCLHTS